MPIFNTNWIERAKSKPLTHGWLLHGAVIDYDDRSARQDHFEHLFSEFEPFLDVWMLKSGSEFIKIIDSKPELQEAFTPEIWNMSLKKSLFQDIDQPRYDFFKDFYKENPSAQSLFKENKDKFEHFIYKRFRESQEDEQSDIDMNDVETMLNQIDDI